MILFIPTYCHFNPVFSENHSNKIQNFMLDVMCPIIQEGDSIPQELLDTVLVNIIEPQKVSSISGQFLPFFKLSDLAIII